MLDSVVLTVSYIRVTLRSVGPKEDVYLLLKTGGKRFTIKHSHNFMFCLPRFTVQYCK